MNRMIYSLIVTILIVSLSTNFIFAYEGGGIPLSPEDHGEFLPPITKLLEICFNDYDRFNDRYSPNSIQTAEMILRNIFTVHDKYLAKKTAYTGEIKNEFIENEYTEGALKVKLTEEIATIPDVPDTYVSIKRRYVFKEGQYQLSAVDIVVDIGEEGVYFNDEDTELNIATLRYHAFNTENILCGHVGYYIGTEECYPNASNPAVYKGEYFTKKMSFDDGTLKYVVDIDPNTYYNYPDKWNGAIRYLTELDYGAVDASKSMTGENIEENDRYNYQIKHVRREIKLAYPEVEYPISAPETGFATAIYAAVAVVSAAAVVAVGKRRR